MARKRKKKLNKRVVVFVSIFAAVVLAAGIAFIWGKMPVDAEALAQRARQANEAENYRMAEVLWFRAIAADPLPDYSCEAAELQIKLAELPETTAAERSERLRRVHQMLETAIHADPSHVRAQRMLTEFYGPRAGETYLREAERLLALVPDDHETYYKCALTRAALASSLPGEYTEPAIQDFRKAIEIAPDEASYWEGLAVFYQKLQRYDEARDTYEKAIAALPDDPQIRVSYATYLRVRDDLAASDMQVQEAIKRAPDKATGFCALAEIYRREGKLDDALAALENGKQADPADFRVYYIAAGIHGYRKEPEKATDAISQGIAAITARLSDEEADLTDLERKRLSEARLQLHYELANRLLDQLDQNSEKKGEFLPRIADSLAQIRQANPDSHYVAKIDGRLSLLDGDIEKATEFLEKADAGFRGVDGQVANMLISIYRRSAPGKAEKIIDRYLVMPQHANNPGLLTAKARFEVRYRNYGKAFELIDKALRVSPDYAPALALREELLMLTGQKTDIPEDMELNNQNLRVLANRASILWSNDQRDQAIKLMSDLSKRLPDNLAVIQQLFNMYLVEDRIDECRSLLKDAQARFPDNEVLKAQVRLFEEPDPEKRLQMRLEILDKIEDPFQRAMAKAMYYSRLGKKSEYMEQLKAAEAIEPDSPVVIDRLFKEAILAEDWGEAERHAKHAEQKNMDSLKGVLYWAQLHISKKEHDEAIEALQKALGEFPDSKRVLTSLGECYLGINQFEKGMSYLERVAANDPSYAPALVGLARATEALGQTDDYVEWVSKAHRLVPGHPYIQRAYMAIQEATSSPDESIARREGLLQKKPDDADNILRLAQLYQRVRQNDRAEQMYRKLWENPDVNKAKAARLLVSFYRSLGRYTDGQKVLDELLATTEDKVMAYAICGEFYARFDPVAAKKALNKAIASGPADERGYRAMAEFLSQQEQWSEAAEVMAKYIELRPDADVQEKRLVHFLIRAGLLDKAEQRLNTILGRSPSDAQALVLKGMLAMQRKDEDQALALLERALVENPTQADAFYYRSQIYRARGMMDKARADLEQARKLSPNPVFAMDLASVMIGLGDRAGAQLVYSEILQQKPDHNEAILALADMYAQQSRWQQLEKLLSDAKARFPADPLYPYKEAKMWVAQDRMDQAIRSLKDSLNRNAGYFPAIGLYLALLIHTEDYDSLQAAVESYSKDPDIAPWVDAISARGLAKQGKEAQADEKFVEALRAADQQRLPSVVEQLVQAYGPENAAQKLKTWIPALRPDDWRLHWQLASVHFMHGGLEEGSVILLKALELADSKAAKAAVNRHLAMAYSNMGKLKEAAEAYRSVLAQFPDDVMALNDLAYLYTDKLGRPDEAVPLAQKAAAAAPSDGGVVDTYGWALAKSGRLPEAERQLARASQLSPHLPDIRYHLGWVNEQMGNLTAAQRDYKQAFEAVREDTSNPVHGTLRQALQRVSQKLGTEE